MAQVTDWIAQSYQSNSPPLNASRVVNMFAELQVQDARSKSPVGIWMHPGTSPFAVCGDGPVVNFTVMGAHVYAITTTGLYKMHDTAVTEYLGRISVSPNGCGVDNNGSTIVISDGTSGWTYNAASGVRQITDQNFFPSYSVTYFDTYFVLCRVGTQEFYITPAQWNGTDPIDGTMFASKEATSDLIVAIANSHQQLFVAGERRIEVWYDAGNQAPQFPFQRSYGAIVQRGLLAPYTFVLEDNTLFFLGDDLVFYRLNNFTPERVSNHAIESKWQRYTGHRFARAFSYTVFGHKMIVLTFPTEHVTWVLDLSTKRWHERESWLGDDESTSIGRWRVNCAVPNQSSIEMFPEVLFGDSQSGRVDRLNQDVFTEFGATMRAQVIGPPIHSDRRRVFMKRFEIEVETGVGLPSSTQTLLEFCPDAITMTTPSYIATPDRLGNTDATFSTFVFSDFVYLPDDATLRGQWFSNQLDDTSPGNGGLQIGFFNDQSSSAGYQVVINAYDAASDPIVSARYAFTAWQTWIWFGISMDTTNQVLQVWVNDTYTEQALTPASITWSSTNPVANPAGQQWRLIPTQGP